MKAVWEGTVIAKSNSTVVVEGNHYFPPESVDKEYLQPSSTTTVCPWKGTASYYNVVVGETGRYRYREEQQHGGGRRQSLLPT